MKTVYVSNNFAVIDGFNTQLVINGEATIIAHPTRQEAYRAHVGNVKQLLNEFDYREASDAALFNAADLVVKYVLQDEFQLLDRVGRFEFDRGRLDHPESCPIIGGWNEVDHHFQGILEYAGFELLWEDEWSVQDNVAWGEGECMVTEGGELITADDPLEEWVAELALTDPNQHIRMLPTWVEGEGLRGLDFTRGHVFSEDWSKSAVPEVMNEVDKMFGAGVEEVLFLATSLQPFNVSAEIWFR